MSDNIKTRISALRRFLEEKNLHAFIIPSTDPHLSEYPAAHWESRSWISGFTGSAGTVVLTREKAGLWTDSRYFIQAEKELDNSGIDLFREGLPSTPTIDQWLGTELFEGESVGIDGKVYAAHDAFELTLKLNKKGLHLISDYDPFAEIWKNRPGIPTNTIFSLPEKYTGESAKEKLSRLRENLKHNGADSILISTLDAVAWLYNIRGNDVNYNPLAVSYAYVSHDEAVIFINPKKLTDETSAYLKEQGIKIAEYEKIYDFVSNIGANTKVSLQSAKTTFALYNKIPKNCHVIDIASPVDQMKGCKNNTEIEGFRNALQRDGIALVKFFMWLEAAISKGEATETLIAEKLVEYRSQQALYVGESFGTIAGYGANGAIVHYKATPESSAKVEPKGLLLVDSGAQYFDGTTDITRTIAVGELTEEMKRDYTMVLKGHIAIATCKFPQGTRGTQIDILARKAMWDEGINFLHGTGHGIGHFLCVHEGPQSIRMNENPTTLQLGMVTSNEPGLYRANKHGIRTENLVLTQEECTTEFGKFYSFETLTVFPIDTVPVVKEMLTDKEIEWLNLYHKYVYDRLHSGLNADEQLWLKEKTRAI